MVRYLQFLVIIFFSIQISNTVTAQTIELTCEPEGKINSEITFTINYEKKEILYMSKKILNRDPQFTGYHYKIRQLSKEHLTAYEPRDKNSVGTSTLVINRVSGHYALATIGNYKRNTPHPLTILAEQGFCE
ncbi:MAG: hypothetical protein CMM25_06000 [Rhodospirillaceae bacterium]|nr:hypothetical protein [Rhodospirillaceae bacterium]|tara:strand:+ start:61 stop:456 length:396 start_codon:yes stop_codon:yes gene_type:complete